MNTSSETEMKIIYEKSIRLLNDRQARLMDMRQVLKKAVIRLSLTVCSDKEDVNNILGDIKASVDENVDIDMLNQHLDKLFVLINHADYKDRGQSDPEENNKNINHALSQIVNKLDLPAVSRNEQAEIINNLKASVNNVDCKGVTQKLVSLVNQSIRSIEREKHELEEFAVKICTQLTDIESFMHLIRRDTDDAEARSLAFTDTVTTGVADIEDSVTKSSDLNELKKHVADNLNGIRQHVEDYKTINKDKAELSSKHYMKLIKELSYAQKESVTLKQQLQESKQLLLRDPLTGIANRLAYEERIATEVHRWKRTKESLCLAMWDIDFFKVFNDTYGHGVGDRVLKLFSDIIQKRIRKVDLFARIGGEEFVLLMPDTSLDDALTLNNNLRVLLEECNFNYDGNQCKITASVGIAEFLEGEEESFVMEKADKALYQSKNFGRNRCTVFDDNAVEE